MVCMWLRLTPTRIDQVRISDMEVCPADVCMFVFLEWSYALQMCACCPLDVCMFVLLEVATEAHRTSGTEVCPVDVCLYIHCMCAKNIPW
jgi:hypothetical protein